MGDHPFARLPGYLRVGKSRFLHKFRHMFLFIRLHPEGLKDFLFCA
jgi:hypothetical protein